MSFNGEFDLEAPRDAVINEPIIAKLTATENDRPCNVPYEHLDVSVRPNVGLRPTFVQRGKEVEITYKPVQKGKFELVIKAFNQPVFEWEVKTTGPVSAAHTHAIVDRQYHTRQRSQLTIISSDSDGQQVKAGSPNVDVNYEGPGELNDIALEELEDRNLALCFVAQKAGEYEISMKIEGKHLKNSPLKIHVV